MRIPANFLPTVIFLTTENNNFLRYFEALVIGKTGFYYQWEYKISPFMIV